MLNFRKITLADRPWIQEALKQSDFMGCESGRGRRGPAP